jgi:HEAT repeat protein
VIDKNEINNLKQLIDQNEIHNQLLSNNSKDRLQALKQLRYNFLLLPDKQQAWNDLIKLTSDQNINVRYGAASTLNLAFSHVPDKDKQQACSDLDTLTNNTDNYVKFRAKSALNSADSKVPDKQQKLNDVHSLTEGKEQKTDNVNQMIDQNGIRIHQYSW